MCAIAHTPLRVALVLLRILSHRAMPVISRRIDSGDILVYPIHEVPKGTRHATFVLHRRFVRILERRHDNDYQAEFPISDHSLPRSPEAS